MVLQIVADASAARSRLECQADSTLRRTNAGKLQQLRRTESSAGQNHLSPSPYFLQLAPMVVRHAVCTTIIEHHPCRDRMGENLRFLRDRFGLMYALAALQRSPFFWVTWYSKAPSCSAPL